MNSREFDSINTLIDNYVKVSNTVSVEIIESIYAYIKYKEYEFYQVTQSIGCYACTYKYIEKRPLICNILAGLINSYATIEPYSLVEAIDIAILESRDLSANEVYVCEIPDIDCILKIKKITEIDIEITLDDPDTFVFILNKVDGIKIITTSGTHKKIKHDTHILELKKIESDKNI